jgi:hypothetical protein
MILQPRAHAATDWDREILLIGSSLSRGVRRPLQSIFQAAGENVRVRSMAPALADLTYHANSGRTDEVLASQDWDVVFLQENGAGISESAGGYQAVRELHEKISSTGATTLLFMTWRERHVLPEGSLWTDLKGEPDPDGHVGYLPIAYELGVGVAPIGWAVRQAKMDEAPIDLWKGKKGRHLSIYGQYLAACVVYSALTGLSPRGVWASERLPANIADFLQIEAEKIVFTTNEDDEIVFNDTWNLP